MPAEPSDFVCMMRVRNEARWIDQVIKSVLPLCPRVFVLDDHSEDATAAIAQSHPGVTVLPSPFTGMNEARDKNWLYDQVMAACSPRWILCVDGDEVLEAGAAGKIREHVIANPCHAYSLKIVFLWNDPGTVRVDRIYGDFWRPSLFSPFHPDPNNADDLKIAHELRFMSTPFGRSRNGNTPNLHCSSVPQRLLHGHQRCPVSLLHYGYLDRADRVRKLDFYTGIDWLDRAEDCYRHMTQGDGVSLDELPVTRQLITEGHITSEDAHYMIDAPADAYLVHAGPLKLEPLCQAA